MNIVLDTVGHPQQLEPGPLEGDRGSAEQGVVEVLEAKRLDLGSVGHEANDEPLQLRHERQEHHGVHHVEDGVGVGDLAGERTTDRFDEAGEDTDEREPQQGADQVEQRVDHRGPHRIPVACRSPPAVR